MRYIIAVMSISLLLSGCQNKELVNCREDNQNLQTQLTGCQQTAEQANQQYKKTVEKLKKESRDMQTKALQSITVMLQKQEQANKKMKTQIAEMEKINKTLSLQISQAQKGKTALKARIDRLEKAQTETEKANAELKKANNEVKKANQQLQTQLEKAKSDEDNKKLNISDTQDQTK